MEKFIHVDRCDSTQDLLKEQLTHLGTEDLTISCEHQIKGRGRGANSWEDSAGTICFSMTILPHLKPTFTALEVSTLVADFFSLKGQKLKLKWPNDLLTSDGKKCGGILVQNIGQRYLAGIGLNLFQTGSEFGGVYETSFAIEKKSWAQELSSFVSSHRYQSTEALSAQWRRYCSHLGREVRIIEGAEETRGTFEGLGPFGEAIVKTDAGLKPLYNGSLRLV